MQIMNAVLSAIKRAAAIANKVLFQIVRWISIICFSSLFLLVIVMVTVRFIPLFSMHWWDEIREWVFAGLIFYGAAGLWIIQDHFRLDTLQRAVKNRSPVFGAIINLVIELASLFFIVAFTHASYVLQDGDMGVTNQFMIPEKIVHFTSLLVPGVIMTLYSLKNLILSVVKLVKIMHNGSVDDDRPGTGELKMEPENNEQP